jgi:hypothetical protein
MTCLGDILLRVYNIDFDINLWQHKIKNLLTSSRVSGGSSHEGRRGHHQGAARGHGGGGPGKLAFYSM